MSPFDSRDVDARLFVFIYVGNVLKKKVGPSAVMLIKMLFLYTWSSELFLLHILYFRKSAADKVQSAQLQYNSLALKGNYSADILPTLGYFVFFVID